jgi:ribosome-associated protein
MTNKITEVNHLLDHIITGIEDVKGVDIKKLDLRKIDNTPCDFFIICTGNSNTQVTAIVSSIQKTVSKALHEKPFHIEGQEVAEWVLIDYIDIVVHVFQRQTREYYNIEELWGDAISTPIASNY